jgi:hypothetical protein
MWIGHNRGSHEGGDEDQTSMGSEAWVRILRNGENDATLGKTGNGEVPPM